MSDDWEESSSEEEQQPQHPQSKGQPAQATRSAASAAYQVKKPQPGKRWKGEDDEEDADEPVSDWEESSDEEGEDAKPSVPAAAPTAAPPKKKGTLKQKLAEKEAAKASKANGKDADDNDDDSDDSDDSDAVEDPREKARMDKERELKADLKNAADLFGSAALGAPASSDLAAILSLEPRTKEDFINLSDQLINLLIKAHQSKPLYPAFVEHHTRALALPLKDVEVRKAASGLTTLANEKQKEQRDRASGKKKVKPKSAMKPVLGSSKVSSKLDTSVYDEALDDFGTNADDFM